MSTVLQGLHDGGSFGIVKLHADLQEGTFLPKGFQKCEGVGGALKIGGDNDVFTHNSVSFP